MPRYDPYAKLSDEKESEINFLQYVLKLRQTMSGDYGRYWSNVLLLRQTQEAIRVLLHGCRIYESHRTGEWDVMYYGLKTVIDNQDWRAVRQKVNDWGGGRVKTNHRKVRPLASISKFVPGNHYHVAELNQKFNSRKDAERAIKFAGYEPGKLIERHVYAREGD